MIEWAREKNRNFQVFLNAHVLFHYLAQIFKTLAISVKQTLRDQNYKILRGLVTSNLIKILSSKTELMHKRRRPTWLMELFKNAVDGSCNWKWGSTMKSSTKSGTNMPARDVARSAYRYDQTVTSRLSWYIHNMHISQFPQHHLTLRKIRENVYSSLNYTDLPNASYAILYTSLVSIYLRHISTVHKLINTLQMSKTISNKYCTSWVNKTSFMVRMDAIRILST
jgi:hypothetical protein